MNHNLLKELPHIKDIYNVNRYLSKIYSSTSKIEVQKLLTHGIKNKYLTASSIISIYIDADCRNTEHDIVIADWVMSLLGPILSRPGPVSLTEIFKSNGFK